MWTQKIPALGRTLLALFATTIPAAGGETKIPFAELAKEFRAANGLAERDAAGLTLEDALYGPGFVGLDLGTFQLWYPVSELAEKAHGEELEEIVLALVDLHERWLEYAYSGTAGGGQGADDLRTVAGWIRSWSPKSLRKLQKKVEAAVGTDRFNHLDVALGAKSNVREALARLRATALEGVKSRSWKGDWKNEPVPISRLVFAPTRRSFLELTAFGGEIDPEQRSTLWDDANLNRVSSWIGRTQVVALVNAGWPPDIEHPYAESSMNHADETGQIQQVVERAAMSLLRDVYFFYGIHFFESAVATNLVIAVCGKNMIGVTTNLDYRRAGATVQGESRFVPGGNPTGGALPQRLARPGPLIVTAAYVSRWDASKGENFFLAALKKGQKEGAKHADRDRDGPNYRDKYAHFQLRNENGGQTVVTAPFFDEGMEEKELPADEFLDDYEDFFRAYRSAFFEWIRLYGGDDRQDSMRRFTQLIEAYATREQGTPLRAVIEEVYGVPLSGPTAEVDSLEWRFLTGLPKLKSLLSGRG